MPHLLLVMAGGAVGAGSRFLLGRWTLHQFGPDFPWGTFVANLTGGLAMGLLVGWLARHGQGSGWGSQNWQLLLGVGLLGGFTTFSAFSLEVVNMIERGSLGLGLLYTLASVLGAVAAVFAGLWVMRIAA